MFNGIAPWAQRTNFATGVQGDGSWKTASNHTLRGGFLVQRERVTREKTKVLRRSHPTTGAPNAPSDQPIGITAGADNIGWLYGVYLQDEWKLLPTVTVNYGLRFDAINGIVTENQVSPRINVVWQPNDG